LAFGQVGKKMKAKTVQFEVLVQTRNHPSAYFRVPSNITTYFELFDLWKPNHPFLVISQCQLSPAFVF